MMSLLSQELAPLNEQVEALNRSVETLRVELGGVEAELEGFAAERQRVDILQDACAALDRLQDLGAADLFWDGLAEGEQAVVHGERVRARIAHFKAQTAGLEEKRESLRTQIDQQLDDLDYLHDEIRQAYAREERRQEEFVVDREVSPVPYRPILMPWSKDAESERRFRRTLLVLMLWSLIFGVIIPLISLPLPDRTRRSIVIPERLAMLVKKDPPLPAPAPVPEKPPEPKKTEPEKKEPVEPKKVAEAKTAEPEKQKPVEPQQVAEAKKATQEPQPKAKPADGGAEAARKKAERNGVLAIKTSFSDLMEDVPVAKLGPEARLSKTDPKVPGQAHAQRALVAIQAKGGSSGGIGSYGVSRDLGRGGTGGGTGYGTAGENGGEGGGNGLGGVGFAKVESSLADLTAEEGRPLSDGPGAGRTDEEIQIVFDRYKATLYRIYNGELRRDPTLRGKLLLRIIIEPDGEVSFCKVESTDLASSELVSKIVARVERFNFGPKDDVPPVTILYPIDFLPAS